MPINSFNLSWKITVPNQFQLQFPLVNTTTEDNWKKIDLDAVSYLASVDQPACNFGTGRALYVQDKGLLDHHLQVSPWESTKTSDKTCFIFMPFYLLIWILSLWQVVVLVHCKKKKNLTAALESSVIQRAFRGIRIQDGNWRQTKWGPFTSPVCCSFTSSAPFLTYSVQQKEEEKSLMEEEAPNFSAGRQKAIRQVSCQREKDRETLVVEYSMHMYAPNCSVF